MLPKLRNNIPINRYDLDLKSCDSRTFTKHNNNLLKELSNTTLNENNEPIIPNIRKIKIGYYFMKTIYMLLWSTDNIKNTLKTYMPPSILNGDDIILPKRLSFMAYNDVNVSKDIAKTLYYNQIKDKIELQGFLRILVFLLHGNDDNNI